MNTKSRILIEDRQLYNRKILADNNLKRIFDIIFSSFIIILFIPLYIFIAFALRLSDRGPIIYRGTRIGCGGGKFACFKFRTMVVDSQNRLEELLASDPAIRREWEVNRKLKNDPRITPIGRFLRQSSLDELPQLINVLRGEMSLVGPRPVIASELALYGDYIQLYLSARPGLTGMWQVSGRNDCSYEKRVELDSNYVRNWRFSMDIYILLRTIFAVVQCRGSY